MLKGVSIPVPDGEFVTLVGPSGCGKTTLLRIIAGLEVQDSGSIVIGDRTVDHVRPKKPRRRDGVSVLRALSPHDRVRQLGEPAGHASALRRAAYAGTTPAAAWDEGALSGDFPGSQESSRVAADRIALAPQASAALRRATTARRLGTRHYSQSAGLPHGRTAFQPGCQAARPHARGAGRIASTAGDYLRLRDS